MTTSAHTPAAGNRKVEFGNGGDTVCFIRDEGGKVFFIIEKTVAGMADAVRVIKGVPRPGDHELAQQLLVDEVGTIETVCEPFECGCGHTCTGFIQYVGDYPRTNCCQRL